MSKIKVLKGLVSGFGLSFWLADSAISVSSHNFFSMHEENEKEICGVYSSSYEDTSPKELTFYSYDLT